MADELEPLVSAAWVAWLTVDAVTAGRVGAGRGGCLGACGRLGGLLLASFSAFSAALCSASVLAFLAVSAALTAAAFSWACRARLRATCWVASADSAAPLASPEVSVGISMVEVTGSAFAGAAADATAMVLRTPPATPARRATLDALRRGFRWLVI